MDRRQLLIGAGVLLAAPAAALSDTGKPFSPTLSPNTAWIVIGVQPDDMQLTIDEPIIRDGTVSKFNDASLSSFLDTIDSFALFEARPGKDYAIAATTLGTGLFRLPSHACGEISVFHAEAGKVVYPFSVSYAVGNTPTLGNHRIGIPMVATFDDDLAGAHAFLTSHYPQLADGLVRGELQTWPMNTRCGAR